MLALCFDILPWLILFVNITHADQLFLTLFLLIFFHAGLRFPLQNLGTDILHLAA